MLSRFQKNVAVVVAVAALAVGGTIFVTKGLQPRCYANATSVRGGGLELTILRCRRYAIDVGLRWVDTSPKETKLIFMRPFASFVVTEFDAQGNTVGVTRGFAGIGIEFAVYDVDCCNVILKRPLHERTASVSVELAGLVTGRSQVE